MEELQEETHATCADAQMHMLRAAILGIEAGEEAGGSSPGLPERPCCREVMLREGLRLSLPERPCCREVMHPPGCRILSAAVRVLKFATVSPFPRRLLHLLFGWQFEMLRSAE